MRAAFARIRVYGRPYRKALAIGALLTLVDVLLSLAMPWPLRFVVDGVLAPESGSARGPVTQTLGLAVAALAGLVLAGSIANYWATRLLASSGLQIAADLRGNVLARLLGQSQRYLSSHRVGDLTARVTSDVAYTQEMLVQILSTLLPNVALVLGIFTVMLLLDPVFTGLALLAFPPLVIATHRSRTQLRGAARRVRRADGQLASAATETLSSIPVIQAFTLEEDRLARFDDASRSSLTAGLEAVRFQARFMPIIEVVSVVSTALVLWFGSYRVIEGELTLGVLLVFLAYLGTLYKPVKNLSKLSTVVTKGAAAAERIEDVLEAPLELTGPPDARPRSLRGHIVLDNVSFSYGREPVLTDLSFEVEAGEHVALVGPSGAGKSTIAALLPRLLDVSSGGVLVDGIDVRDHNLISLRSQMAVVFQETVLFDGTLRDNIICGADRVSGRQVQRAARLALVDEFADRLPEGLDTWVGERGASLSGGQRQRVAVARAILRDAPILILDEPTSALDAASEELLLEALDNLPPGRTRIVIAHRLSTVRSVDRVLVIDRGRVRESGSHDQLVAAGGLFDRMVRLQEGHRRLHAVADAEASPAR